METGNSEERPPNRYSVRPGFIALLAIAIVGGLFWLGLWYAAYHR